MKLSPLQRRIVASLEPLPTGYPDIAKASLMQRGMLRLSQLFTSVLRRSRPKQPMVWDPWILPDGDVYRLFYLEGVEGQIPWWTVSKLCGAVSSDLEHWQALGPLLEPNPANDWESGRISAGCTYKEDGIYYLFYSAGGKDLPHLKNEAIGLATSTDGITFSRVSDRPVVMPDCSDQWYRRCNWTGHFHWRDPYIFKRDGKYYMFICASANAPGNFQGCVGLAVADRIAGPYTVLFPAIAIPIDAIETWPYYHLERPQVIYKNGQYHLFFSCFKMFFNPNWLQTVNRQRITNSSLYWYVSDTITGPYHPVNSTDFVVKGSERTGMYGTNLLQLAASDEFLAYGWYHRLHTLEVSKTFQFDWSAGIRQSQFRHQQQGVP